MLRQLKLSNFKSWPKADLEFGRITGLFGTNSSGKSSLIQSLLLLKQTKEATDRSVSLELNGPYVKLGLFRDLVHRHDEARKLTWSLLFDRSEPISLVDPRGKRTESFAESNLIEVTSEIESRNHSPTADRLSYKLGDVAFHLTPKTSRDTAYDLYASGTSFRFTRNVGRTWQVPGPVKSYAFPDQARTYFQNASFLSDLEAAFEEQIESVFYLGPLRDFPQRDYLWARSRPKDVGVRGEKAIDAILAATAAGETRNKKVKSKHRPFQEMIAFWLKEMGLINQFSVTEIAAGSGRWQAKVRVRKEGTEALLTDVGFGVSQVLPVITLLLYVPEGSTVILEQPEIHLHPLAQAHLADVIINTALTRNLQVIVESHSEHMLLRMQRRVAEQVIDSKDLRLYFSNALEGDSQLELLRLNLLGQIENWPTHFMGDAFGETFAAEEARLARLSAQ